MSNTVKQLGFIPTNRGEFDTTGQTKYYKDNVVQYRNGSYICSPVGYSTSNPTAYTTDAPYQDSDTELNANWKLMASVGLIDDEPTAGSDNLVKSGGVYTEVVNIKGRQQNYSDKSINSETGEEYSLTGWGSSLFVGIEPNTSVVWKPAKAGNGNSRCGLCFYDENKNRLSGYNNTMASDTATRTVTSPSNAAYVRCSFYIENKNDAYLRVSGVTIWKPEDKIEGYFEPKFLDIESKSASFDLVGNNNDLVRTIPIRGFKPGNTYRIYIKYPNIDRENITYTSSGYLLFAVQCHVDEETASYIVYVGCDKKDIPLDNFYEFIVPENVSEIGFIMRATKGALQTLILEDVTTTTGLTDETHLVNPTEKSLAKAEDAMQLKVKLDGITAKETKGNTELDYNGFIVCKTVGASTEKTFKYDGTVHTLFIPISEGAKRIRFLGRNVSGTSYTTGYCFINALNQEDIETNILVQEGEEPKDISNYIVSVNPWRNVGNNDNIEIIVEIPDNATYFCTVYGTGNITKDNFYCYLQSGEGVKDLIPEVVPTVVGGGSGVVCADAIKDLATDFYPFKPFHYRGGSNFKQRYINSTSLKWVSSTTYRCYIASLKDTKFIRVVANESYEARIAFLKDDIITVDETPNFCDNTSLIRISANNEKFLQVPNDANYLYVYTGTVSEGFLNLPAILEKSEKYTTSSEEEDMNSKIYSLMEEVKVTLPSSTLGYIVTLSRTSSPWFGQWYQAQRHFEIPVSEKDKYVKIVGNETNSTSYSFFTAHSVYPVTSGAVPDYAEGIDQAFILPENETVICKIPDGTKYIYIRGGQSTDNLNYQPQYVAVLRFPEKEDPYDVLSLNPDTEIAPKMLALQKGSGGPSSTNGVKPNTFMFSHITDCHGGTTAGINSVSNRTWERFLKFSNHWKTKGFIDDIVDTGDIVGNVFANSIEWRTNADNVLNVIGNHDTATISSGIYDWTAKAGKESYDKYLSPYIQNWNVTQPENADTEGYCYYYKDYVRTLNNNTIKLRCVFVDVMGWDSNNVQKNWLDNVLEDARTNGFVVCIFTHFVPIRTRPLNCSFTSKTLSISTEDFPYLGFNTYCKQLCACVRTFQDNGGIFSCYIAGHRHIVGIAQVYGNVTIDGITYDFNDETKPQIVVYGSAGYVNMGNLNDYIKQANTKNEDNFQIVAIDPYKGIDDDISSSSFRIKVLKIGCNYNRHMQNADVVNITYYPYPPFDYTNQNYRIGTIVNKDNVLYKFLKPVYIDGVLDWDNSVVEVTNRIISE